MRYVQWPQYFSSQGNHKTSEKLCSAVVDKWLVDVDDQKEVEFPKGTWNYRQMCSMLRDGGKTLANKLPDSSLNKSSEFKQTERRRERAKRT